MEEPILDPELNAEPVFPIATDAELPFQEQMFREHQAKNAHQFILYFNVHDYVFTPSLSQNPDYDPQRLRAYLGRLLYARGFEIVIYYSLTTGLQYLNGNMGDRLVEAIPSDVRWQPRVYGQHPEQFHTARAAIGVTEEPVHALTYLYHILTYPSTAEERTTAPRLDSLPRIAVILEYLESLAPHEDSPHQHPASAFVIQMLHRWAMDRRLQDHIIVGLTSDLGHVASGLYSAGSETRAYRIDLPAEMSKRKGDASGLRRDRSGWLEWVIKHLPSGDLNPLTQEESIGGIEVLAAQTSGFNYDNLRDIVYYAARERVPLRVEDVQRRKRDVITAQSRDLLEFVEPEHGMDMVAGYEYVKRYLRQITEAILRQGEDGRWKEVVPKGILLLGPPGTGKSFMATALAKETGFNMVKLRNIRNMYVGESERNLNRVLDLLSAMHPVIVFVDEVDAALGMRPTGGSDAGSGVERRIFQRILEYMAMDDNRGRILWIGASNRPDQIDAALLSRFDLVLPFLLPDASARKEMLTKVYPDKIGFQFERNSEEEIEKCIQNTEGLSGRELDTICRRALQVAANTMLQAAIDAEAKVATEKSQGDHTRVEPKPIVVTPSLIQQVLDDFRQARNLEQYELQTLLAIQSTNFRDFLPSADELPPAIVSEREGQKYLDEEKLQRRIAELQRNIGRTRLAEMGLST